MGRENKTRRTVPGTSEPHREYARQLIHIGIGLFFILVVLVFGRNVLMVLAFFTLILGSLLVNMGFQGKRILFLRWAEAVERPEADFAGYGSTWYVLGVLLLATFLTNVNEIAAGIFLLGISDGLSTLVGMQGRHPLPLNPKKTWEGSAAFFLSGLGTYFWVGPLAFPLALLATVVESLKLPWDDNILVPLVCVIAFLVV